MPQHENIDEIYNNWNDALASKDIDSMLSLYADNATIESPLISHLLKTESGVLEGKEALKKLLNILFECQPTKRQFYRKNYFTDGKCLMWEYPRLTPTGEQMDFTEVMEIEDGLIKKHRVYWGWYGVNVLKNGEHFNQ